MVVSRPLKLPGTWVTHPRLSNRYPSSRRPLCPELFLLSGSYGRIRASRLTLLPIPGVPASALMPWSTSDTSDEEKIGSTPGFNPGGLPAWSDNDLASPDRLAALRLHSRWPHRRR